ncbi:MAG: hypothetical protein HKO53_08610 [Gemmatimonadetes bacterium]|nr:hypothetical protein [Gemmatimonadota bacterium]
MAYDQDPTHRAHPRTSWRVTVGAVLLSLTTSSCSTLQQLVALRHVDFSLDGVAEARLVGIDLVRTGSYSDLTLVDVGRVANALATRDLPLDLRLALSGENPPDNPAEARLVRMDWTLLLDGRETVSGVVDDPVAFPPGTRSDFHVDVNLDLGEFFDGTVRELLDLAIAVAGGEGDGTEVALRVLPTVDTALGPIRYPEPITLVRTEVGR